MAQMKPLMTNILIQVLNQCRKVGTEVECREMHFQSYINSFLWSHNFQRWNQTRSKKIEAVKTMMIPMLKLELQSFLSLCNYLAVYVSSLSSILHHCVSSQRKTLIFNGTLSMTPCINVPRITFRKLANFVLL